VQKFADSFAELLEGVRVAPILRQRLGHAALTLECADRVSSDIVSMVEASP
jgi:hypothetical protein